MELTRAEVDTMLRRADEVRTKLRRATRELREFGTRVMAARDQNRSEGSRDRPDTVLTSDDHRSR